MRKLVSVTTACIAVLCATPAYAQDRPDPRIERAAGISLGVAAYVMGDIAVTYALAVREIQCPSMSPYVADASAQPGMCGVPLIVGAIVSGALSTAVGTAFLAWGASRRVPIVTPWVDTRARGGGLTMAWRF